MSIYNEVERHLIVMEDDFSRWNYAEKLKKEEVCKDGVTQYTRRIERYKSRFIAKMEGFYASIGLDMPSNIDEIQLGYIFLIVCDKYGVIPSCKWLFENEPKYQTILNSGREVMTNE